MCVYINITAPAASAPAAAASAAASLDPPADFTASAAAAAASAGGLLSFAAFLPAYIYIIYRHNIQCTSEYVSKQKRNIYIYIWQLLHVLCAVFSLCYVQYSV